MYRVLHAHDEVRERRRQLRHPAYQKPELLAEAPNQVWSWDITKLMGPAKGCEPKLCDQAATACGPSGRLRLAGTGWFAASVFQ